jgi:hypothetical protein
MSSFLSETLGVASSGVSWDVGDFKIWQSTRPDVALFIKKRPELIINSDGRYAVAVTTLSQQQPDRSIKIIGGSAAFSITSAVQWNPQQFQQAQDSWRAAMGLASNRPIKFVPLNVQKGQAQVLINPTSGKPNQAHNDKDVGTPGGTLSFLVELTELGAQEWAQGIKNKTAIPAGVKFMYEYLRLLPPVGSIVTVHGQSVFEHLSAALNVSYDGFFYGGSAKIEAEWENMQRSGAVEVVLIGTLPPELEQLRDTLTSTFASQAREIFFNQIFAPKPDVKPAQAGSGGGLFGGANFALKWKKATDAIDLSQTIRFEGYTWLPASMDTDLTTLFAHLDSSYVNEVQPQQAFDSVVVIDGDPILSDVAVSLSYSEGHSPEVPVFGSNGGTQRYTVYSVKPENVSIKYRANINYASPRWPIVPVEHQATVGNGGNLIELKPAQWVGRHQIYMFVRDGDRILSPTELTENDYLILNVSYSAPFLANPIRDSAHLSGLEMVEFSYPIDPNPAGAKGEAKFSAFGVIGGKLVHAGDQVIDPDETAVFVLATKDGKIQLVSKSSLMPEDDKLAQRLLEGGARPIMGDGAKPETEKADGKVKAVKELEGMTVAVEYGTDGPILWVEKSTGERVPVRLHSQQELYPFGNTRKHIRVRLDETGTFARDILVELDA